MSLVADEISDRAKIEDETAHAETQVRPTASRHSHRLVASMATIIVLLALWTAASAFGLVSALFLPSPIAVTKAFWNVATTGFVDATLLQHLVASLGRVFAALFASTAPTGVSGVDVVYRAAFAVVVVLAGSRARRWALVVASLLVAVASLGPALFAGAVALALAAFLASRNRRDRVYGAAVGALVSFAALHLSLDLILGDSVLVVAIAAGVLVASGYRNTSRRVRRRWKLGGIVVAIAMAVGVIAATVGSLLAAGPLFDGVDAAQRGADAVQNARRDDAAVALRAATSHLSTASDRIDAWWVQLGRAVPLVSQNLAVVQGVARSSATLTRVATDLTTQVNYEQIRLPQGGINLSALGSFRQPLLRAAGVLAEAQRTVDGFDNPWQLAPLADRLVEFSRKVDQLHRQTAIAALAVDRAPAMLGAEGERHYLVLLGDPAEARDLGGHIGNWAELDADGGQLRLQAVGIPNELRLDSNPAALASIEGYPPSLTEMKPLTFPQNWGASPDMAEVARLSAELYQRRTGRQIHGVFYADPSAFARFLAITGPIEVQGLGWKVTTENAAQFLTSEQFVAFPQESEADSAVTQLVRDVFDRLTTVTLPSPRTLAEMLSPVVRDGHLKLYSLVPADRPLLAALGIDGVLSVPPDGDVVGVINRNANPSKIDTFLHRSTTVDVRWDPATGAVTEQVTVTLRNDAPAAGLPAVVIGNRAGLPNGTNLTDLALLTNYELTAATLDGQPVGTRPVYDGRYWRDTVRVELAPGQTRVVSFDLEGSLVPSDTYSVFVVGQPLVHTGSLTINVHPSSGTIVGGKRVRVGRDGATVRLRDGGDTLVELRVQR